MQSYTRHCKDVMDSSLSASKPKGFVFITYFVRVCITTIAHPLGGSLKKYDSVKPLNGWLPHCSYVVVTFTEFCDWTWDIFDRVIPLQLDWVLLIMLFTLQKTASWCLKVSIHWTSESWTSSYVTMHNWAGCHLFLQVHCFSTFFV